MSCSHIPEGQRLVILAGSGARLSQAVKSRLGLESHPPWENRRSRCLCHRSEQAAAAMSRGRQPITCRSRGFDRRRRTTYDHQ